jgi:ferrous iron transport protein B
MRDAPQVKSSNLTSPGAAERRERVIALVGNPNTGKSSLFTALSGVHQRVGNYPGVTVEKKLGHFTSGRTRWTLLDLPGTYSLAPHAPDEMVTVDVLLGRRMDTPGPDVILCVVDASNLRRNLYLVSQLLELGRPLAVALTMNDVAAARGLEIDVDALSRSLGVPVVRVNPRIGQGLDALKAALVHAAEAKPRESENPFPEAFRREVDELVRVLHAPRYLVERLVLDTDGYLEQRLINRNDAQARARLAEARERVASAGIDPAFEASIRQAWAGRVVSAAVDASKAHTTTFSDQLDRVLTHPFAGMVILAAVLLLIFQAVFTWAQWPMQLIESAIQILADLVVRFLPDGPLQSLLAEGVIGGVGSVLVFLPQILILFGFLGVLEDCGYLARAAYLMDRWMAKVGLSGKSFIPLLSSFACAIPGVMAARVIEDRRDRLTTILIAPLMSCSARLPVYTLMIAAFVPDHRLLGGWIGTQGLTLLAMYLIGIVIAAAVSLIMKRTVLRGEAPAFVMELPSYKRPGVKVVLLRMVERAWIFVKGAGTMILAVSIIMWALLYYPRLGGSAAETISTREAALQRALESAQAQADEAAVVAAEEALASARAEHAGMQQRQSWLGRIGRWIEPAVRPLGWDWRIGSAVIASFPAREVVVASLGVIFDAGPEADEGSNQLRQSLQSATWPDTGKKLFNLPVALSIMVFFALCAQCVATLAVIQRETNSWIWPIVSFVYMTTLAYLGALVVYQVGMRFAGGA